jgi:class 3 adenylate cyclase
VTESERPERWRTLAARARRLNQRQDLVGAVRQARARLPGDDRVGDRPPDAGTRPADIAVRQLAGLRAGSPGLVGEVGLTALQLWQALAESRGRGRGDVDVALLFTDLVGFSGWALEAGDEVALELLREVADAVEPPIRDRGGEVVKRLGDGLMAAFRDGASAADAGLDARERLASVEVHGYRPRLRAGVHLGRPRRVGGDYLGVDVNIAARLAEAARADEVLVSDTTLRVLDVGSLESTTRSFQAKGVPRDLAAHSIRRHPVSASP